MNKLATATMPFLLALAGCSAAPPPPAPAASTPSPATSTRAVATATAAPTPKALVAPASAATRAATPDPAGAKILATLRRYHWQLDAASDAGGHPITALFARADKPVTIDFSADGLSIANACNAKHASADVRADKLVIGRMISTMMVCADPALAALERVVDHAFSGSLGLQLDAAAKPPKLTLTTAPGDVLVFVGKPTAETRFGGPGETMFLEVAPNTKPCHEAEKPAARCLNVREVHYDSNGVKLGEPGPWHLLTTPIEGFEHQTGVRNVLRVKRYHLAHAPAHAATAAYVLDMVVETESPHVEPAAQ